MSRPGSPPPQLDGALLAPAKLAFSDTGITPSSEASGVQEDAQSHASGTSSQLASYRETMRKREHHDASWAAEKEVHLDAAPDDDAGHDAASHGSRSNSPSSEGAAAEPQQPPHTPLRTNANEYDPYASQSHGAGPPPDQQDEHLAICRICLDAPGGSGDEGESLGRLLSPCRCKGTMKYVHATCLNRWRALSARNSSVVSCDQCGAPYRFRKSRFVGLATSPLLLFGASVFLFLSLIWSTGFVASHVLRRYDLGLVDPAADRAAVPPPASATDWDLDGAYMYTSYWGYGGLYYEPLAYVRLIKEAVRQFATGEATEAVRGLVGIEDERTTDALDQPLPQTAAGDQGAAPNGIQHAVTRDEDERSFWSALKWKWTYGTGGIWEGEGQDPAQTATAEVAVPTDASEAQALRERYDARTASPRRRVKAARTRPAWLDTLLLQFSLGFSLVGIVSFVNLLLGFTLLGPMHGPFGFGRTVARLTGRRRGGERDGASVASVLLVLLVLIGVARALVLVYRAVQRAARYALARLEDAVVDWHGEDEREPTSNRQRDPDEDEVERQLGRQRELRNAWLVARAGD